MHNRDKTHCPKGHPYDEDNTIVTIRKATGRPVRKCAECMRENQRRNRERYHFKERTDPERRKRRQRQTSAWRDRHPEKRRAWAIVWTALRKGELVKADACERCGASGVRLDASHDDYDRALEIEWLCVPCHRAKDRRYGAVKKSVVSSGTAQEGDE